MTEISGLWSKPDSHCDLVMKGGITSGVIYPQAITTFAKKYRFHSVGGASAGAIGAAFAAAAEYGRYTGGFDELHKIPGELKGGALVKLFQPEPGLGGLFRMLRWLTEKNPNRVKNVWLKVRGPFWAFPLSVVGFVPGVLALASQDEHTTVMEWVSMIFLLVIGFVVALLISALVPLFDRFPENLYGLCRGLAVGRGEPPAGDPPSKAWERYYAKDGLTDWLARKLDEFSGIGADGPLTFAHLENPPARPGGDGHFFRGIPDENPRAIQLRMVASCMNRARPYEFPQSRQYFFFDPSVWETLFPAYVVAALRIASAEEERLVSRRVLPQTALDAAHEQKLHLLPSGNRLPVVVAARMSLSFPLLFSAIPLWVYKNKWLGIAKAVPADADDASVDRGNTSAPVPRTAPAPASGKVGTFELLWFLDGGLCSNFPLHLFEKPLATRPTFAINLGRFRDDNDPQNKNVVLAGTNSDNLAAAHRDMTSTKPKAVISYVVALVDTMRNWQDNSYLTMPGYRDRIVRVQQTKLEGGLNLNMRDTPIQSLADKGTEAAGLIMDQFEKKRYKRVRGKYTKTGWENHRWVRYRAVLAVLPDFLLQYGEGRKKLGVALPQEGKPHPFTEPVPGYEFANEAEKRFAADLDIVLLKAADLVAQRRDTSKKIAEAPQPRGRVRRVSTF